VQAGQIHDETRHLRSAHPDVPLPAADDEIAGSGGCQVASAADRIGVNRARAVGSIGAMTEVIGFTAATEKVGISRRLVKSSEDEAFVDTFERVDPARRAHVRGWSTTFASNSSRGDGGV
jgi:protease-4